MENPFRYGGVVGPEAFCNRDEEQRDLRRCVRDGGRLFLYAERRLGKTSLVKRVLADVPEKEAITIYADLWPTDGPSAFAATVAKAIAEATATTADKLLKRGRELFSSLRPSVTVDESGAPVFTFGADLPKGSEPQLREVLAAPQRLAEKEGRRVVVAFDEFQQITEYDEGQVERLLRSESQHHTDVAYLFLGSRKHLIQEMFLKQDRPLYRAAEHYPLQPIAEEHWQPFIRGRFESAEKTISEEQIGEVCTLAEGHPFYVQHLCHVLWERCEEESAVEEDAIEEAVRILLDRESYAYSALWESLTKNQRRFLKGLAAEGTDAKPYGAAFVQRYRIGSPSSAQRAAEALLGRGLIDRESGSFVVLDRFFALWIIRRQQP